MHGNLVVSSDKIYFGKSGRTSQVGCKILNVWNGIPVSGCDIVEPPIVHTAGRHSPFALGTIWSGEAHVLEEGRMIPMSRSLSNSALAAASFSGDKQRGRAMTGRPSDDVVGNTMFDWCVACAWCCQEGEFLQELSERVFTGGQHSDVVQL